MKHIVVLTKDHPDLAVYEVAALAQPTAQVLFDNILLIEHKKNVQLLERLAYTKRIYTFVFQTTKNKLAQEIQKTNWQKFYTKSFCVRIHNGDREAEEKELAGMIWEKLSKPKVNLRTPGTLIEFFYHKNYVLCGILQKELKHHFEQRRADKRPLPHPSTLDPKLARAMINLLGIAKGTIVDPFVGSGGILIEAGLMGFKTEGYDNDKIMIKRCKANCGHFNINAKIFLKDSFTINKKIPYLVTDLPYGKATKKIPKDFYKNVAAWIEQRSVKKAVVGFPSFANPKKLFKKLKIQKEFTLYLHKSLSKKIVVLSER